MKILVTGAAGFVGSHLCERLAGLGHDVSGIDCFTDYYARALKDLNAADVRARGCELAELDLATDDLASIAEGAEIIYHLAAQPGISATVPLEAYVRNNLTATHRLLEAVAGSPTLRCFINISTSSVYGAHATDPETAPPKPTSYYGVTKLAAEQLALAYCREGRLPACSFRLFSVFGPRERPEKLYSRLIRCILEDTEFPLYEGSLEHRRSFTFIDDIIEGFVLALGNLDACVGEVINIGTDTESTTRRGIEIIEQILGREARKKIQPRRPGDQLRTHADIGKARSVLGYAPKCSLDDGLREQVAWYRDRVHGKVTW